MARIDRAQHRGILHAVDIEGRRVVEVAAEHGCTPANIYALLSKLRRVVEQAAPPNETADPVAVTPPEVAVFLEAPTPVGDVGTDLFATSVRSPARVAVVASGPDRRVAEGIGGSTPPRRPVAALVTTPQAGRAPQTGHATAVVSAQATDLPGRTQARERPVGAALARPGFGLLMRNADGEEVLTPFRSLEDLLSAIKPMLRTAARCPDPVWFSIQSVNLATLDEDAA